MLGVAMRKRRPKLYALPASAPCATVEAALELKSIDYERVDLLPMSQTIIGPIRYGGTTVPGMRLQGERLVGSRLIMRRLDALVADPPLLPAFGSPSYAEVLEAERWGDEVFQNVPRRLTVVGFIHRPAAMETYAGDKLPLPIGLLRPGMPLTARLMGMRNKATDHSARAALQALPGQLDIIDGWIADRLLGQEHPNAADLQIGSNIRLLLSITDLRPLIEGRPAAGLAGYFPPLAGRIDAGVLPAEWFEASGRLGATQ
jgi:glutathione S-transferase